MVLEQRDLSRMLETGVAAARLAGQRAMEELSSIKVSIKNNSELVTQADAQCQQIIIDKIKESYPNHGFIAEEGDTGRIFKQPPRGTDSFWWVIDPIDGTNNYAHQMLLFTVSIAVMHKGESVAGAIFEPATNSMFTAVKGGQAQMNGKQINAGEEEMNVYSSVGLDSHFDDGVPDWACKIMQKTRFRNIGTTALQLAYVAKGGLVATIAQYQKLWDIAAGILIAEVAGAAVSDWQGGKIFPVDLDGYEGQKFYTIAANKKVHAELLQLLKSKV
ncbi:MAG: inositol monophosphatase [Phycisphaerae bacterium]|nr:inositol monophosphatase [Phycisphaerae bacterium]MDD5381635.1 inositol monophosphatase [Phycisphaerae bacterium]